jgi:predicted short-subunit dehydrogenase-like oxidoreductase (DUF2520 family)
MRFGLFGGGAVSVSFIARHPGLAARLGPVAASSYRVASRIVNSIRAGQPVKNCEAFEACSLVLVSVPGAALPRALACLLAGGVDWGSKQVLLCDTALDSSALAGLRQRGAATATLNPVEALPDYYVAEGDRLAVRQAKHLVHSLGGRTIEIDPGGLALYHAGLSFAGALFAPLAALAIESLRRAGCKPTQAAQITGAVFSRTLRAWLHAGKKSWTGSLAAGDEAAIRREIDALARANPAAARFYRQTAAFALEYFGRHPGLRLVLENDVGHPELGGVGDR